MIKSQAPMLIEARFGDFDEFADATAGWDLEFGQLERGPLDARLVAVAGSDLTVHKVAFNRSVHQRGCAPEGMVTFGLPDHTKMLSWLARRSTPRSLVNFNRPNGFESVSNSGFSGLTFSMTPESFSRNAEFLDPGETIPGNIAKHELFRIDRSEAHAISRLADGLFRVASMEPGAACYAELESDLVYLLSRAIHAPGASLHRNTLSQRQKAVDRSIEYIRSLQGHVKVSDVYRAAHVSWRTLDRGFRERFGITPKQFIVVNRLNRARRALTAADTDLNVSRIALEQGFWHLGRFSADYKAMFGELPSATLRRGQA